MQLNKRVIVAGFILLILAGCSVGRDEEYSPDSAVDPVPTLEASARPEIVLPVSLYILVDDADDPNPAVSSARTEAELATVLAGMNEIWAQAGIRLEAEVIDTIVVPEGILLAIMDGDFRPFYAEVGRSFEVPNPSLINGFYARSIGGPNGIAPTNTRTFFVTDTPSVFDRRVGAHEVGHILELHHVLSDADHLLSPGVNGMTLDPEEGTVARYAARGLLDGVR